MPLWGGISWGMWTYQGRLAGEWAECRRWVCHRRCSSWWMGLVWETRPCISYPNNANKCYQNGRWFVLWHPPESLLLGWRSRLRNRIQAVKADCMRSPRTLMRQGLGSFSPSGIETSCFQTGRLWKTTSKRKGFLESKFLSILSPHRAGICYLQTCHWLWCSISCLPSSSCWKPEPGPTGTRKRLCIGQNVPWRLTIGILAQNMWKQGNCGPSCASVRVQIQVVHIYHKWDITYVVAIHFEFWFSFFLASCLDYLYQNQQTSFYNHGWRHYSCLSQGSAARSSWTANFAGTRTLLTWMIMPRSAWKHPWLGHSLCHRLRQSKVAGNGPCRSPRMRFQPSCQSMPQWFTKAWVSWVDRDSQIEVLVLDRVVGWPILFLHLV